MVWVYEDPPFTKRELKARMSLKRKLKDKEFVDRLIKIISLYNYLRRIKPSSVKDIEESAFFDKAKTKPIFDRKTSGKILRSLNQKGGDSKYPYTDTLVKGVLRDYTPGLIREPVGAVFNAITDTVDTLKGNIPFADLALSSLHGATEVGVTAAGDIAEGVGGPVGAAMVAPFAGIAAALASGVSTLEGDIGQSVAHMSNAVPLIGSFLGKMLTRGEHLAQDLKPHQGLSSIIPYMTEYHNSTIPSTAGKRFSTLKHRSHKWQKKTHRRSVTR